VSVFCVPSSREAKGFTMVLLSARGMRHMVGGFLAVVAKVSPCYDP
jgi:hypothetical protein